MKNPLTVQKQQTNEKFTYVQPNNRVKFFTPALPDTLA